MKNGKRKRACFLHTNVQMYKCRLERPSAMIVADINICLGSPDQIGLIWHPLRCTQWAWGVYLWLWEKRCGGHGSTLFQPCSQSLSFECHLIVPSVGGLGGLFQEGSLSDCRGPLVVPQQSAHEQRRTLDGDGFSHDHYQGQQPMTRQEHEGKSARSDLLAFGFHSSNVFRRLRKKKKKKKTNRTTGPKHSPHPNKQTRGKKKK